MITRSVKLPESLVRIIDGYIESEEYSTRADFVLHAMRQTIYTYSIKRIEILEKNHGNNRAKIITSEFMKEMTRTYENGFKKYDGKQIQINTRVPEGLDRKIDLLIRPEFGFKNKSEFARASIMCLLIDLSNVESAFDDEEKTVIRRKEISDKVNRYLEEGFESGKTVKEILDAIYDDLKNEKIN